MENNGAIMYCKNVSINNRQQELRCNPGALPYTNDKHCKTIYSYSLDTKIAWQISGDWDPISTFEMPLGVGAVYSHTELAREDLEFKLVAYKFIAT